MTYDDMVGQRYGRLAVVSVDTARVFQYGKNKPIPYLVCKCDCGNTKSIIATSLKRSLTLSCGCLRNERIRATRTTHGQSTTVKGRQKVSKEYKAWSHMLGRCYNQNDSKYHVYGGRGVNVCSRWRESFENFYADVGPAPSRAHSLDRRDVDGNYEPGNVRWATALEQAYNKQDTVKIVYKGEVFTLLSLSERTGIPKETLRQRIKHGWSPERVVETPLQNTGRR